MHQKTSNYNAHTYTISFVGLASSHDLVETVVFVVLTRNTVSTGFFFDFSPVDIFPSLQVQLCFGEEIAPKCGKRERESLPDFWVEKKA